PEQVRAALVQADNVALVELWSDPLFFAPHPAAVWPRGALVAVVEQLHPRRRATRPQRVEVMRDFEQPVARGAAVQHVLERPLPVLAAGAAEPGLILHATPRQLA